MNVLACVKTINQKEIINCVVLFLYAQQMLLMKDNLKRVYAAREEFKNKELAFQVAKLKWQQVNNTGQLKKQSK